MKQHTGACNTVSLASAAVRSLSPESVQINITTQLAQQGRMFYDIRKRFHDITNIFYDIMKYFVIS